MQITDSAGRMSVLIRAVAAMGAAWNVFGVIQFWGQVSAAPAMLMAKGMTADQANFYASPPGWMTIVFGIGVFGGLAGSFLLLAGRRLATTLFGMSLVGYIALYIGDITEGVFAAFGTPQIVILTIVVAIAVGLLMLSLHANRRGWLR
ncbi:hypothetical protein [Sphingomonas sp. 28-62-11]|uniref:hypothetical protein n=1 Tax=Sphingomonas sp. 28-62-11 TaxID=1970432 RepID=UPI000BD115B1|nr:MAG: hypothetical protein B7Y49_14190 [Sphingomonas sp. 28-62-11]